jgi:hypothetical protein
MTQPDIGDSFELGGWRSGTTIRYGSLLLLLVLSFLFSGFKTDIADGIVWVLNVLIVLSAYRLTSITNTPVKMGVFVAFAVGALVLLVVTDAVDSGRGWGYLAQFGLLILIALGLVGSILRRPQVDAQTLVGAAAVYVLLGLAFSWLYLAIDVWDDSQISLDPANTAEYPEFSFVVLTTIGFGNQLPTASLAARLVVIEALIAQLFLATFVARMVAMYGTRRAPEVDETNRDAR